MDLLEQGKDKNQSNIGKNIVLTLLIISIMLLIFAIVALMAVKGKSVKPLSLVINKANIGMSEDLIIQDENEIGYIAISKISKESGYDYLTGEYKKYNEDNTNTKCYLQSKKQVIQFEADSNIVYKTDIDSKLDYEEYKLKNKIIKKNELLYIAFEDINVGLNLSYEFSERNNRITLKTVENLKETYRDSIAENTQNRCSAISDEYSNSKAILYDMLVVSNENNKWGVIDRNDYSTIIGNKYSTLNFVEQSGVFIASDDGKYGIISKEPNKNPIVALNYEEIKVINNSPLCYAIKLSGKYAIIDESGNPIINETYEEFGCEPENPSVEDSVLAINDYGKDNINMLVVRKEGKYGLINLDNGTTIINCGLDRIYSKNENGKKKYYIKLNEQEVLLDRYIEKINTTNVIVGNN